MERCGCCNKSVNPDEIINGYCGDCWGKGTVTIPAPVYEHMISKFSEIRTFSRYVSSISGDIPRQMCEVILGIPVEGGLENGRIH